MMQASCLLCWHVTMAPEVRDASSASADEGATMSVALPDQEIDKPAFMKERLKLGPFQTQIIGCKSKPLLGESHHVMIMLLRASAAQPDGMWPLPPGLHVLNAFTQVSVVVRNMLNSPIFLKKGVWVVCMVSASLVFPVELSPEMEVALEAETACEPMMVATQQEKLLKKLNLDSLSRNVATTRELVLAFHDIFMLDRNELGCRVRSSIKSASTIVSFLKSGSGTFLCHFLMRYAPCSETC